MDGQGGPRRPWPTLPAAVRDGVADILGAAVVQARSQTGGFSPGSADRVVTADGRRAFVKASDHPGAAALHRREAAVTAALPAGAPVPRLLGVVERDGWVALVLTDVDGRPPTRPWPGPQLTVVLDQLTALAEQTTPCPVPGLPTARAAEAEMFTGARRLAADGITVPGIDLVELAGTGLAALDGDTVVHRDLRADNILLTEDGPVLLDWPHAARGPAWLDTLILLVEVQRLGSHDVDALLATHPRTRDLPPSTVDGVLAGLAGGFLDQARRPPDPALPTVRRFQQVQGEAVVRWLRRRSGGPGRPGARSSSDGTGADRSG